MIKNIKNKRILIVGGAGFIGHNLALRLKELKAKITVVDGLEINNLVSLMDNRDGLPFPELSKNIIDERMELLKKNNIKLFIQDARDYHAISKIINATKPQVIVHLAAVSHSDRSNKYPYTTFDHSFRTLENVLDNAKNKIEHLVFLSSSMVYGNFKKSQVTEDSHCEPIGIYGALKFAAEKIIIAYNQVYKLDYTIIRPSALYGERCVSRRVGQIFIENAINGKKITVNGKGEDKLDFTYIQDLVQGIVLTISNKKSRNQIFNLTFGRARPILEMIKVLKKDFKNIKLEFKKRDKLMPKRGTLSIAKAKKLLGYKPTWSLEKGYPEYIKWYKNFYRK